MEIHSLKLLIIDNSNRMILCQSIKLQTKEESSIKFRFKLRN